MSCLPDSFPRVLMVGPGVSATYGTLVTAATTSPASTQAPAISRVTSRLEMGTRRSGMGGSLRTIHPLTVTTCEELVLPDRHRSLQVVDELLARGKGDITVLCGASRDHSKVTDLKLACAVRHRECEDRVAASDLLRDLAAVGSSREVRPVGQGGDAAPLVMITDRADEDGDATRSRVGHRGADLVHRQRLGAQLGHPAYRNGAKATGTWVRANAHRRVRRAGIARR